MQSNYWRWQKFKLAYILSVIFLLPGAIIGFFALYLAIYEPDEFRTAIRSKPQVAVNPLESPTYFVRQDALKRLIREPPDRSRRDVVDKVKKLLRDSNPQAQELAIEALGKWGRPEDARALGELAADPFSVFVRPAICRALGELGGRESCGVLVDILAQGSPEPAIAALRQIGPTAEPALQQLAVDADAAKRAAICTALAQIGTAESGPFLEAAAGDDDPEVAKQAKLAMAAVKSRQ
jgi:HEAT repeat protein